jgi:hypothetical protein
VESYERNAREAHQSHLETRDSIQCMVELRDLFLTAEGADN